MTTYTADFRISYCNVVVETPQLPMPFTGTIKINLEVRIVSTRTMVFQR
jgi:hypothetical protein